MTEKHRTHTTETRNGKNPFAKLLGLGLVVILGVVGLIGLVFPIIPGLLFLFLALYVLSRVSRRFAFLANRNSWLRRGFRRLGHIRTLPPLDLLKLGFWVSLRGTVNGISAAGGWMRNTFRKADSNQWRQS